MANTNPWRSWSDEDLRTAAAETYGRAVNEVCTEGKRALLLHVGDQITAELVLREAAVAVDVPQPLAEWEIELLNAQEFEDTLRGRVMHPEFWGPERFNVDQLLEKQRWLRSAAIAPNRTDLAHRLADEIDEELARRAAPEGH